MSDILVTGNISSSNVIGDLNGANVSAVLSYGCSQDYVDRADNLRLKEASLGPQFYWTDGSLFVIGGSGEGIQGTIGSQGIIGSQGTQGVQGLRGGKGLQGTIGSQGTTGVGSQGTQGTIGLQGFTGSQGTIGAGTQGTMGSQGTTGTGIQGTIGTQGSTGSGTQGTQGTFGIQGILGTQGTIGSGTQGTVGSQGTIGSQGTFGSQGTQGIQGRLGTQGTQGTMGLLNDASYNTLYNWELVQDSSIVRIVYENPRMTFQTLSIATTDSSVLWPIRNGYNAKVVLTRDVSLFVPDVSNGDTGTLMVIQDASGSRLMKLPSGSRVMSDASTLSTSPSAIDFISFIYDVSTFYWNIGKNYIIR